MRAAADTNILVYAVGVNDEGRHRMATTLLAAMYAAGGVLPAQALAELHHVLVRKFRWDRAEASDHVAKWSLGFTISPTDPECIAAACALADDYALQIVDAIMIAAAARAGCRVLFSEDMQHDAIFGGVMIVNPFRDARHPMLRTFLTST
jgi:predicted nucleic acid-binding protein